MFDVSKLTDAANTTFNDLVAKGVDAAQNIYTAKAGAQTASQVANAEVAQANASVLTSKNIMIGLVVLAVAVGAFFFLRKK